jgi:hypothetical protein
MWISGGGACTRRLARPPPQGAWAPAGPIRSPDSSGKLEHRLRFAESPIAITRWPLREWRKDGADRVLVFHGLPAGEVSLLLTAHSVYGVEPVEIERTVLFEASGPTELVVEIP